MKIIELGASDKFSGLNQSGKIKSKTQTDRMW